MYQPPITLFTEYFFGATFWISTHNSSTTGTALTLVELVRISLFHAISISLVWMTNRDREMIFYIENELLFDDFEWSFGYFTLNDSCEESINIFLSEIISHDFFIILIDRERCVKRSNIGVFVFTIVPIESSFFRFLL